MVRANAITCKNPDTVVHDACELCPPLIEAKLFVTTPQYRRQLKRSYSETMPQSDFNHFLNMETAPTHWFRQIRPHDKTTIVPQLLEDIFDCDVKSHCK
jgi:hypothetical protein